MVTIGTINTVCMDSCLKKPPHSVPPALLCRVHSAPSPDRRDQILLDERCLLKGWTPLHYATAEGSPTAVSTLLAAGASVSVHGAVLVGIDCNGRSRGGGSGGGGVGGGVGGGGSGGGSDRAEAGTALQLARALLSKEGGGLRKKGLQEVARQLNAATQAVERAKEQRERKEREAKVMRGGGGGVCFFFECVRLLAWRRDVYLEHGIHAHEESWSRF